MNKQQNDLQSLFNAALDVQAKAHAPYSDYRVGSALVAEDGNTYTGCNVENVSFPLGQCAEGNALAAMVAGGARQVKEILIASPNEHFCSPCGGCRQRIFEFASKDTLVHMATSEGEIKTLSMNEILPFAFDQ